VSNKDAERQSRSKGNEQNSAASPGSTSTPMLGVGFKSLGFRSWGLVSVVRGSGFRVQGSGFKIQGSGFRVQGSGFRVSGSEFRVEDSGFRVRGL